MFFPKGSPGRIIIFGAHPDDAEIGCGGTLARLAREGAQVTIVAASVPSFYERRIEEGRRGAKILGATFMPLFNQQSRLDDVKMHVLVQTMDAVVAELRPDLVFVHSTSDLHWDHGLTTRAAMSALRRIPANLLAFSSSYELNPQARTIGQLFVDITQTLDIKLEAISAHQSQMKGIELTAHREQARAMGRKCGAEAAEVFEVLRLKV